MHKRGVPAAGRRVEILTSAYPTMRANVLADANGDYSISGIPTGIQHTLYWSSLDSQPSVYIYYATLAAAGENKAYPTYTLPKEQIITANVRYADGSPAAGVMLSVTGSLYYDFNTYADSSGSRTLYVYGEQPKVAARHPLNDDLQPFYQATGPDGDARSIQLDFPSTGTITGKLTHGGVPIGIAVAAVYGGVGTYAATGKKSVNSSGSTGDFELKGIPVGVTVTLEVAHPDNYNIKLQRTVTIPAPGATVSGQDIEIPLYARVTGRVTMASGSAAWGAVTYTPDGGGWTKTDSLSSGNFVFTGIPPGTSGTLSVAQPVTSVKSTRAVTVPSGTLLVSGQDITLTGVGGITGRFLLGDGTPAAGTYVYAYYTVNSENDTSRAWYTGADGRFTFSANLPVGQPVLLSTYNPHNSYQKLERTVTIQSDGQVLDVGDLQLPPSRTLTVEVRDALDRVPYYSYVTVTDAATGQQVGYAGVSPYSPKYTIRDLTASRVKVVIVNYSPYQEVARTEADVPLGQVTALVVRVSVVNGTVKFDDGTVVPNPALSVYATQQTETGARSYLASTPGNGVYEILGLQPGPFELFAQDTQTALSRVVSGTVPALTSVVTTDVFLPPAGTVTGVVRGPTGAAVSGATVYLRADGLDSYRSASTNASGVYTFARVPVGLVWVESRNASTGAFGSASGTVAGSGQTLTLDIAQVAVANVAGTVKNASGTAASYGTAIVERVQQAQAGLLPVVAYPSASGVYSASAVPGEIRVVAIGSSLTTAGIATYTLEAGGLNGADVTLGNAVSTYSGYNLRSPPPTPYEFYGASCAGAMYTNFETLLVNGVSFPCTRGAYLDAATGEITYGPFKLGDLRVSRRLYAPTSGESFARYVESVTNDSASPLTVEVRLRSTSGYSLTFRPDRRSWVSHGNGTGEAYQEHVIGGAGTVELASVVPQSSATTAVHKWTTTLAPGATAKYMHFVVSRGTTCAAGTKCVSSVAEAVGADLISGADPRAFTGLTDTDRAQIRNFALQ